MYAGHNVITNLNTNNNMNSNTTKAKRQAKKTTQSSDSRQTVMGTNSNTTMDITDVDDLLSSDFFDFFDQPNVSGGGENKKRKRQSFENRNTMNIPYNNEDSDDLSLDISSAESCTLSHNKGSTGSLQGIMFAGSSGATTATGKNSNNKSMLSRRNRGGLSIEVGRSQPSSDANFSILSSSSSQNNFLGLSAGILESPNNTFLSDVSIFGIGGIVGCSTLSGDTPSRFEFLKRSPGSLSDNMKFDFEEFGNPFASPMLLGSPFKWDAIQQQAI